MNKKILAATLATVVAATGITAARADDGPWEVRLRALYLDPNNGSDSFAPLGIPADAIHINNKVVPDLDFEYYFTRHFSSELVLTYPQKQSVTVEKSALGGPTVIGTFRHLPPTLTAKYNFLPDSMIRPYVGVGVNLTYISNVDLAVPTVGNLNLSHWSLGPAAQAGADWALGRHWFFNTDLKWVMLKANVTFDGTHVSQARVSPLLVGVGFGYRFGG